MSQAEDLDGLALEISNCRRCPRLTRWREQVARERRKAFRDQKYWGRPVPGWGDPDARLLVVGLAPAAHGANRTGRLFTGDSSGDFLFAALHRAGLASQPQATGRDDGLRLSGIFISAACRCAPPGNRPTPEELTACRTYLLRELAILGRVEGVVVLGRIALNATVETWRSQGRRCTRPPFGHARLHRLADELPWLVTSYHPSRQNTQTGRLTPAMFDEVWRLAQENLAAEREPFADAPPS